jgi:predicted Rossmann fold nucleotide-binding protein DprA/Smf involved in DNA uptake
MYTRVFNEQSHQIEVEREFRSFAKPDLMNVTFNFGEPGDDYYDARISSGSPKVSNDALIEFLKSTRATTEEIKEVTGLPLKQLKSRLDKLIKEGQITVNNDGIYSYIYKEGQDERG